MKCKNILLGVSLSVALGSLTEVVNANPTGAQVINGQVTFSQPNTNTFQVNNSNGAIINWQEFSINSNELTHFQQSGADSAVLNQVVGNNASNIFGSLTSNGQVYLINQNGIIFGENSIVNTAGFIASTLNLSNQDFLEGKLNFKSNSAGDILNQGFITAGADGDIALIAANIVNEGIIEVEQGDVILAAGEKVTLTSLNAASVGFEVQATENNVVNLGSVTTDGGAVGMFASTLTHSGVINATALSLDENGNVILVAKNDLTITESSVVNANGNDGGRVLLQSQTGTTLVSGEVAAAGLNGSGGVIDVLGEQVGIIDNASLDASGSLAGGDIHVGGNYQGNGELQNATATYVGQNTNINASAIDAGNGGEVIVWADETTRAYGSINASAGGLGGAGGFIETSGKHYLDVNGIDINVSSVNGENGTWLLDPTDITISTAVFSGTEVTALPNFTASSTTSNINVTTLEVALNSNANVVISTSGAGVGVGDITLDAALLFDLGNTSALTLNADNDIVITANGSVSVANGSNFTLNMNANRDINIAGNLSSDASSLLLINATADNDASTVGAITLSSAIASNGGNVNLIAGSGITLDDGANIQTLSGNVLLDTVLGDITLSAGVAGSNIQTSTGDISLQAQSSLSSISLLNGAVSGQLSTSGTGNVTLIADEINHAGFITSGGVTTLKPFGTTTPIQLLTADSVIGGTLVIGSDELALITGDVDIGDISYNSPININSSVVFSSGSTLSLITANSINFNQTGTGIDAAGFIVKLQANGIVGAGLGSSDIDILADNLVITSSGSILGFSSAPLELSVNSLDITHLTLGTTFINNTTGLDLALTAIDSLTASTIDITHDADIQLDVVSMTGDSNLLLTAAGGIIDANGDPAVNIDAGYVTLVAASGIGSADALETQNLIDLTVDNSTTGSIEIEELVATNVNVDLTNTAAGGEIKFTNLAGVTSILAGGEDITTNNGAITLISNDINVLGLINSGTAALTISSGAGSGMDLGTALASTFVLDTTEFGNLSYGNLVLGQAGIGNVNIANGISVTADATINGANIEFSQPAVAAITATATSTVTLNAQGSIIDNSAADIDIVANSIILNAEAGIGDADAIDLSFIGTSPTLSFINNNVITTADVNLNMTAGTAVEVTGVNNATVGGVDLIADSIVSVNTVSAFSNVGISALEIVDGSAGELANITADSSSLFSASGIGVGNALETDLNYLSINNTSGNVELDDLSATPVTLNILNTSGDVVISSVSNILLETIDTSGAITLTSTAGAIVDGGDTLTDLRASNIVLTAANGIGDSNQLEMQLTDTLGIFTFNNTANSVDVINTAINVTDVMQVSGSNNGAGGSVIIRNNVGVTDVVSTGISSNQGLLEISTNTLNVNAALDNSNGVTGIKLLADVMDIAAGINSTAGDILIAPLTNATGISFEAVATGGLELTQTEIDFLNSSNLSFGAIDFPAGGQGTGNISFNGGINFGSRNVSLSTMGNVVFAQGVGTALTTAGNVFINALGNVLNQSAGLLDIDSNNLDFTVNFDFGNTATNAIELNVFLLAGNTSGGEIYVDSEVALNVGLMGSTSGLPIRIEADGNVTLATISSSNSNITIDTSAATNGIGGAILDDGVVANNINGAAQLTLLSETGVGSLVNHFEVNNVSSNIVGAVVGTGGFYLDNVGSLSGSLLIDSIATVNGDVYLRNLNALQTIDLSTQLITTTGNIIIESNSDLNVNNTISAGGGSDVTLSVVGGLGDININNNIASLNNINISTVNGSIVFGASGFVAASTVDLQAYGTGGVIDGSAAASAIGGGSFVNSLIAHSQNGISLSNAGNDAGSIYLSTTTNNINYTDVNGFALDAAYASSDGTATGTPSGDVFLTAADAITDANADVMNIVAVNASVTSVNGIGNGDSLETSIEASLNFNNSLEGSVQFVDTTFNDIQVWGVNSTANTSTNDFTQIVSQNGSLTVPVSQSILSANGDIILSAQSPASLVTIDGAVNTMAATNFISLEASLINISGSLAAVGTAEQLSIAVIGDEFNLTGSINAGVGDFAIGTLTDGVDIYLASGVDNAAAMDISQAEIALISAGRMSIGSQDVTTPDIGTNSIIFEGAINTGTIDTRFASVGDIIFNQGATTALSSTSVNGVEFDTQSALVDQSAGTDIAASNGLSIIAVSGVGSVDAIDTQVAGLQISNSGSGAVNIDNASADLSIAFINQNAANADINLNSTGGITLIDNGTDVPGITSSNGAVSILTAAGLILDEAIGVSSITGANSVNLSSTAGIGSLTTAITLESLGAGGLTASSNADIYITNTATNNIDFIIAGLTINNGAALINNLDAAADTRITGIVNGSGVANIVSLSSMQVDGNFSMTGAGGIDLQVNGAGGSLFVNSGLIQSETGNIALLADDNVQLLGTASLYTTPTGTITLTSTNGRVFSDATAAITGGAGLTVTANFGITLEASNDVGVLNLSTASGDISYSNVNDIDLGVITASATSAVTLNSAGAIFDANGVANNIEAQTVLLNAVSGIGTAADPIETAANALQFVNTAQNDVVIDNTFTSVLLGGQNTAVGGNVIITSDNGIQLLDVRSAANLTITSLNGSIDDGNDAVNAVLNLSAANINLTAVNGIGNGNTIETQLTGGLGNINLNNSGAGNIEVSNFAVTPNDVVAFAATNAAANGAIILLNKSGATSIGNINSAQGLIELMALELNLNGTVTNNAGAEVIRLAADEFNVTSGGVNAGNSEVQLQTLQNGLAISLGSTVDTANVLDISQSEIDAITAARISIGALDVAASYGSGDVTVAGSLDTVAADLNIQTLGNIIFANGAANGLSTTGIITLVSEQAIIGENSTGTNLIASSLAMEANNGIGSINVIRTQTTNLSVINVLTNDVMISNTGALNLSDSANMGGAITIISDSSLTITPGAGVAGTASVAALTDVTLQAATTLTSNGQLNAAGVNLLATDTVTVNDIITASGSLNIDADTNLDGLGDLIIENTTGNILEVTAANIDINAASVTLSATNGAVHVESAGYLNIVAANDLNISGGNIVDADAYLSAAGNIDLDIGANLLMSGGNALNTTASIIDVSGAYANALNMNVGGNVTLSAGAAGSSGALIEAGAVAMTIAGDMSLTGSAADDSGAVIASINGPVSLDMPLGSLTFVDGTGIGSETQLVSSGGSGYMAANYLDCVGCDTSLIFLAQLNDMTSTQTSTLGTGALVSSSDALVALLDEALVAETITVDDSTVVNTAAAEETSTDTQATTTSATDEEEAAKENDTAAESEPEAQALVCR